MKMYDQSYVLINRDEHDENIDPEDVDQDLVDIKDSDDPNEGLENIENIDSNTLAKTDIEIENENNQNLKGMNIMATCSTGLDPNCGECCGIFTNNTLRTAFGYQIETAPCTCHDICVEDVRDICVERRTLRQCVPCNPDSTAGCRGGFLPDGPPTVQSWRVLCAEESLSPATGCDRIINNIEFEVVLRFGASNTLAVVTPKDTFECFWHEFARFPTGVFYPNTTTGLNQFRNELAVIDGSCKVIIIEAVRVVTAGNDCILEILYKVVDKLWKHENLLVSALKPYSTTGEVENITVSQEFAQGHKITACSNSGPCPGTVLAG